MISIIIPTKPPEPYLETLEQEIHKVLRENSHEILIQTEPGLGYAVQQGVKKSKSDVVVIMDADGSHDPHELPKMLELLKTNDVVLGSRYTKGGINCDSFTRRLTSYVYNNITQVLLGVHIKDAMSGFVVAKKEVFADLNFPKSYKFMLPLYMNNNLKVAEHPIQFQKRKKGKSKVSFVQGLRTLMLILKLMNKRFKGLPYLFLFRMPFLYVVTNLCIHFYGTLFRDAVVNDVILSKPLLSWLVAIQIANFIMLWTEFNKVPKHPKF